jgi:pimeloyl-ACP methyl ester carboxylesterase
MAQCAAIDDAPQRDESPIKELELDRRADSVIVPRMASQADHEQSEIAEPSPDSRDSRRRSIFTRDVAARGARVRFVETGDGPPLLLVHGYLGSHSVWDDAVDALSAHFRTLAPDLPGFGESEKPPAARYPYNVDAFAESLADLVASLELGRVVVCGHDLGGAVALTMAARHPAMVERLVLVDPIVYPHKPDLYVRLASTPVLGPLAFKQLSGRGIFGRYFSRRNYSATHEAAAGRIDILFEAFNAPAAREAAYATLQSFTDTRALVALLPRVHAPSLVVWGRNDRLLPVAHGRRLSRELPHARLEIVDAGHSPHEELPVQFAKIAHEFLASGNAQGRSKSRPPRGRRDVP